MNKQLTMDVNFGGRSQAIRGEGELKSISDAALKAVITCFLCWMLGTLFMIIPIINTTLPAIFWMFGPVLGLAVFYKNHNLLSSVKGQAECPQCNTGFEILEHDLASPFCGQCPTCKAGYLVHIESLEPRPTSNPIKDPQDERYVPNSSAITMKALQGRGAFFEEEWQTRRVADRSSVP